MFKRIQTVLIPAVMALAAVRGSAQTPLGTDFTYQGRLSASGLPAVSSADFQFALFDAQTGGAQIGSTLFKENVALSDGIFTLSLDFGAAFDGESRWLEVSVRSPAGAGGFTALAPRQPITATPQATFSSQTRGISVDDLGRVGIGTATPSEVGGLKLDVAGGNIGVTGGAGIMSLNAAGTSIGAGVLTTSTEDLSFMVAGTEQIRLAAGGNVGIGTATPQATLHIKDTSPNFSSLLIDGKIISISPDGPDGPRQGWIGFAHAYNGLPDLYIGSEGGRIIFQDEYWAARYPATGPEDFSIISGNVSGNGDIESGVGFSVNRTEEGHYIINYSVDFAQFPAVTATVRPPFSADSCFAENLATNVNSCHIQVVRRSDGDVVDRGFGFIAIGPR